MKTTLLAYSIGLIEQTLQLAIKTGLDLLDITRTVAAAIQIINNFNCESKLCIFPRFIRTMSTVNGEQQRSIKAISSFAVNKHYRKLLLILKKFFNFMYPNVSVTV